MYIIRSANRDSGTVINSYFRLNGLPSQYKKFKVEVVSFYNNFVVVVANTLVELKTDLGLLNGYDVANKRLITIATNSSVGSTSFEYVIENFNGRTINFTVADNDAENANNITDWVLYLKMTGIEE